MRTIRIKLGDLRRIIREEASKKIKSRLPSKDSYEEAPQRKKLPKIKNEEELDEEDSKEEK